jgi:hypothetical protein
MYFFDPDAGRRRRALVRDRIEHLSRVVRDELETELRDAGNRLRGVVAGTRRLASGGAADVTDESIAQAVRRRFASLERPDAIVVEVREGCVHLRGPALARDAERARRIVRRVRGARALMDALEVHAAPDVPALQTRAGGGGAAQIDPTTRLAVGIVGAAALLPLVRHVPISFAVRLLALGAIGSAIYGVERDRRHAIARGRAA